MTHDEQMAFLYETFDASLPRLGPGDDGSTRRALNLLLSARQHIPDDPNAAQLRILDIGCGNGAQTIALAKYTRGKILAVDNHQPYLDELRRRAETEGFSDRVEVALKDMCELGLPEGSFDLIWSEGALYSMGFREGLAMCHPLLVPGGMLAASELSWLQPDPPAKCRQFFANEYPAMVDIDVNLAIAEGCGYEVVGHFTLPEAAWRDSFYHPLEDRLRSLRERYASAPGRLEMIDSVQAEIDLYDKYSRYYGYVFYLLRHGSP